MDRFTVNLLGMLSYICKFILRKKYLLLLLTGQPAFSKIGLGSYISKRIVNFQPFFLTTSWFEFVLEGLIFTYFFLN